MRLPEGLEEKKEEEEEEDTVGMCPAGAEMKGGAQRCYLPAGILDAPWSRATLCPWAIITWWLPLSWVPGPALPHSEGGQGKCHSCQSCSPGRHQSSQGNGVGTGGGTGCRD